MATVVFQADLKIEKLSFFFYKTSNPKITPSLKKKDKQTSNLNTNQAKNNKYKSLAFKSHVWRSTFYLPRPCIRISYRSAYNVLGKPIRHSAGSSACLIPAVCLDIHVGFCCNESNEKMFCSIKVLKLESLPKIWNSKIQNKCYCKQQELQHLQHGIISKQLQCNTHLGTFAKQIKA